MLAWLAVLMAASAEVFAAPTRYQPQVINPDLVGARRVETGATAVFVAWGTDATIFRSEDGREWRHADTSGTADLAQIAADPMGTVLVAVGAQGTILRSIDTGRTWQPARNRATDTDLRAVVHAGGHAWIAAGTAGHILRSTDDARTWSLIDSHLGPTLRALSLDGPRILIGGDGGLVGFSLDQGESWQVTAIAMPDPATPISGFHRIGKLVLATSALGRFLVSADGGDSWDLMQSTSQASFTDAAWDPDHDTIVMTGHNGDVLRSADGGQSWEGGEIVIDGRKNFLSAIRHDPRAHALLVTGQSGTIARSTDGGRTWASATREPGGGALRGELRGLVHDPRTGTFMVFGTGGLLASSTDGGARWQYARESLEVSLREIVATPHGDALVATSRLGHVLRSADSGASWRAVTPNYPDANTSPDLRALLVTPAGDAIVAVGPPGAILRGDAEGANWRIAVWNDIEAARAFPWVLADATRNLVVAVEARGAMMVSRDDGASWSRGELATPLEPGKFPLWQGAALGERGVLVVAGEGGLAARSTDDGASWQRVDTGTAENLFGSYADDSTGAVLLSGSRGTLLRSTDLGITWRALTSGSDQELRGFQFDARTRALLCFGNHGTTLRSHDQGRTWRRIPTGVDGALRKSLIEPGTGNLLVAGSQGTLLRSADGGATWQRLETHTSRHFSSVAADSRTGDLVLVGDRIVRLVRQSRREK
ncbi:MAG TPA: YCF48-related protein [Steroidobacteraceae bacterium]|nr:YCF48-related protein [Steroidobacteraceae bacterium]